MKNQFQIVQAATGLFKKQGFDAVTMTDIAAEAGVKEADLYTYFGNKQDVILFLFQSINSDWQLSVNGLSEKKLAERFEKALTAKIELLHPYSEILSDILGLLIRNPKIGIYSPRTSHIRMLGMQNMQVILSGASDSKSLQRKVEQLPSLLYLIHWAIIFLHIQGNDKSRTLEAIKMVSGMLKQVNKLSFFLPLIPFFKDVSAFSNQVITGTENHTASIDKEILKIIFNHRKTSFSEAACKENNCGTCFGLHQPEVAYFTQNEKPLHFILPAFPAKSPNQTKVLGLLPDLGEKIALQTLEDMCKEIESIYPPGALITICSDGRIFSELVGVTDEEVTHYVAGIKKLISNLNLKRISIVNLEDLLPGNSFDAMRNQVLQTYSEPMEELHSKRKNDPEFKSLFNGIHRFISDDRKVLFPEKSGSRIKEESKEMALQVIQHSNAWTRFLAYVFPEAIRLSIHPYPAHSPKIGIQLTKTDDNWLTPWHGAALLQEDGYVLVKRSSAEEKNARLVYENGQPSHFTLIPE